MTGIACVSAGGRQAGSAPLDEGIVFVAWNKRMTTIVRAFLLSADLYRQAFPGQAGIRSMRAKPSAESR